MRGRFICVIEKTCKSEFRQSESVCAGALDVQLAGDAVYFGKIYKKDYIGDAIRKIEPEDILRAGEINVYDNDTDDGCLWRFIVMDLLIRFAKMEDAEELLALYTPYVTDTVITFEYEVPSLEEFKDRMRQTMRKYPYLVAEQNGERFLDIVVQGAFKGRAAYDWAVETTIYIRKDRQKTGVGKKAV